MHCIPYSHPYVPPVGVWGRCPISRLCSLRPGLPETFWVFGAKPWQCPGPSQGATRGCFQRGLLCQGPSHGARGGLFVGNSCFSPSRASSREDIQPETNPSQLRFAVKRSLYAELRREAKSKKAPLEGGFRERNPYPQFENSWRGWGGTTC